MIYVDIECIIEKIDECKNNPENSCANSVSKHISSSLIFNVYNIFT